ncbi:EAL domain-containing protein [Fundicoccus ignavus]|uniref:EAL domain-containing protein n=1 Tax=Fundicoccus ignavus TaxID=2664442 RepID=UPI001625AE31|nr:EAL domain-containing protein [Fundicoccus ignavus]
MREKQEADVSVLDNVQQLRFVFQPILLVTEEGSEFKRYETLLRYGESTSFPTCLFNDLINSEENCNVLNAWYEKTIEHYLTTYPNVQFSINIDMKQMVYDSTWEMLKKISRFTGRISIELTEFYQLMPEINHQLFIDSMAYFRSLGLGVAFDDVGNGQHSMGFVTQNIHRVDCIKLSLLHFRHLEPELTGMILDVWVKIALDFQVKLVVEGIETQGLSSFMRQRGVHYQQGFLWGVPSAEIKGL